MSPSDDNLKALFEDAFAAEQIPVDMDAWGNMETMLDNRKPKGIAYWVWLPILLAIGGMSSWYWLEHNTDAIYHPRAEMIEFASIGFQKSCADVESSELSVEYASLNPVIEPKRTGNSSELKNRGVSIKVAQKNERITEIVDAQASIETLEKSELQDETNDDSQLSNIAKTTNAPEQTNKESLESEPTPKLLPSKAAVSDEKSIREELALMPLATIRISNENLPINNIDEVKLNNQSFIPTWYVRAGVSKSFNNSLASFPGIGQSVGAGYMRQLKPHLLVSAEANASRLRISDTANIKGESTYGFRQFENYYVVETNELLRANATIMAHYRIQRFYFGGGFQPTGLLAVQNSTSHNIGSEAVQKKHEETQGYYQWNRYKRFGCNALIDLQYQVIDEAFIGLRGSYGLNNTLNIDYRALRIAQIEAYLKLNIR